MVDSSKNLRPWRATIVAALCEAGWQNDPFLMGPVHVSLDFALPRPGYHYRKDGELKDTAPSWHDKRGDLDKLTRAVFDALTQSGAIRDDSQVAAMVAVKRWSRTPGVRVTLNRIEEGNK